MGDASCMSNPLSQQVYQSEDTLKFHRVTRAPMSIPAAGNLTISTDHTGTITGYNHTLDLAQAIATTTYVYNGIQYTRTAIASHPDNVIAIRWVPFPIYDTSRP